MRVRRASFPRVVSESPPVFLEFTPSPPKKNRKKAKWMSHRRYWLAGCVDERRPQRHVHRRRALVDFYSIKIHLGQKRHVLLKVRRALFHADASVEVEPDLQHQRVTVRNKTFGGGKEGEKKKVGRGVRDREEEDDEEE